jgi:hypothetical protein
MGGAVSGAVGSGVELVLLAGRIRIGFDIEILEFRRCGALGAFAVMLLSATTTKSSRIEPR